MSTTSAGRINSMVGLCRHLRDMPAYHRLPKAPQQSVPMTTGRRLDIYEAVNGALRLTAPQRRRLAKKLGREAVAQHAARRVADETPILADVIRRTGVVPEPPCSWEQGTTLLPLVGTVA